MSGPVPLRVERSGGELPTWRYLDLGRCEPLRAQAFVESVAASVAAGEVPNTLLTAQPATPYVSLGFHQSFSEEIDPGFLERRRVPVVRRVEGGGTTWLDPDQWFYQLVYRDEGGGPGGADDLRRFLAAPALATQQLGVAAELRLPSDLVVGERKLSGNAGGDWAGAHLLVGGILGRADHRAMSDLLKLPHPAVRPLLRREVERWVTSWEGEAGTIPPFAEWRDRLLEAFGGLGLFRVRPGRPTPAEEARFRTETLARHTDPAWRELAPLPRRPGPLARRLRVAGPRGILVFRAQDRSAWWVAVVEGETVREAYGLDPSASPNLERLETNAPQTRDLEFAVREVGGVG